MTIKTLVSSAAALAMASAATADVITQWDFNASDALPSVGSGSAMLVGGVNGSFAAGGPGDPVATGNQAWNTSSYPAQGTASGTAGVQFNVSTVDYFDINVEFEHRQSNTGSRWLQFQYALDSTNFVDFGTPVETLAGATWYSQSFDLSSIPGAKDNADFAFRIAAIFAPGTNEYAASNPTSNYGTGGTIRFDMVTVNGTLIPAPGSLALLGLGGFIALRRRR